MSRNPIPQIGTCKKTLARKVVTIQSPLRYPGGKRRLASYVAHALRLNGLRPALFVEPFAGGASVALQLLNDGQVDAIALGERDPLVASFWKTVFREPEWLVEAFTSLEPSVELWGEFRRSSPRSDRDRALKCLFLNRTSFSGILSATAGPIGGKEQSSDNSIDCRYAADTVAKRIRQAAQLAEKVVFVKNVDWQATLDAVSSLGYEDSKVFYYLDPPFFQKADRLYRYFFGAEDHKALHDRLVDLESPWLLSYDPATAILDLYSHNGRGPKRVDLLYSAMTSNGPSKAEEVIVTSLPRLPRRTKLWRTAAEWKA